MKDNIFLKGINSLIVDLLLPIVIYIFITYFVSALSESIEYFLSYKINTILLTAIASLLTAIILLPIYIKNAKERQYYIEKFDRQNIKYILGLGVSLCLFFNTVLILLNIIQNDIEAIRVSDSIKELNPIVSLISVCIIVPLCEELVFRAMIFKSIEYKKNFFVAALVSSSFFAIMHGNISQGIYAFFIGFVLCYVFNRFGGLKYSYLLHLVMNFSSLLLSDFFVLDVGKRKDQIIILILSLILFIITAYRIKQTEKRV